MKMENINQDKNIKKVIFYTEVPRLFRTTLIGYLYDIAQKYPVVLLSEKLDKQTENILKNKDIFPKLEEIIPVYQYGNAKRNLLDQNKYFCGLAKKIINKHSPDVVISGNDMSHFEIYLMRFGKRAGAVNICFQGGLHVETNKVARQSYLTKAYLNFPYFVPFYFRLFFLKIKRYLAHFLFYWILPLLAGEAPFMGKSSIILWKWVGGLRDAHFITVFSEREYDSHIEDSVPREKIYILPHPLKTETRKFFETSFFNKIKKEEKNKKTAVLMLPPGKIGFKRGTYSLISQKEREKTRLDIVKLLSRHLPDWNIFIKPHPVINNIEEIRKLFESVSENIEITESDEPADKYIEMADLIIGLPPSNTTTLYTAVLQHSNKPILSLDFDQEFICDIYRNIKGVDYIKNIEQFVKTLILIRNNNYQKKSFKISSNPADFKNACQAIEFLYKKI